MGDLGLNPMSVTLPPTGLMLVHCMVEAWSGSRDKVKGNDNEHQLGLIPTLQQTCSHTLCPLTFMMSLSLFRFCFPDEGSKHIKTNWLA